MMLKITILCALFTALGADFLRTPYYGTTYESCSANGDCRNGWSCLNLNGKQKCSENGSGCRCYPEKFRPCKDKKECPFGERCDRRKGDPLHCYSEDYAAVRFEIMSVRSPSASAKCEPRSGDPQDTGFKADSVLSYGRCRLSKDCKGDRECHNSGQEQTHYGDCCSEESSSCYCVHPEPTFCMSESDCESGESCVGSRVAPPRCMDTKVRDNVGSQEFETGALCIDAEALSHLQAHELVFEKHQLAHVLCDDTGSCATPGHIVVYNDKSMMMRTYCDIVSCRSEVKRVNSPSWRKGMRIASKSEGLEYTTFAARWGTRAEEHVLNAAIRVGL